MLVAEGRGDVVSDGELSPPISGPDAPADAVRALDAVGVGIAGLEIRSPTLDDVFFSLTGRHVELEPDAHLEEVAA